MTAIRTYIQKEILLPRLLEQRLLVVYDQQGMYKELCLEMAASDLLVVDASVGSIEAREEALAALRAMGQPGNTLRGMLVYVPAAPPATDEERQHDPFALYAVAGRVFPAGDGDEYISICLKAKPDHRTEIYRVFNENDCPPFEVIDSIGGAMAWPWLKRSLRAESPREVLLALMAPDEQQHKALRRSNDWRAEAKELLQSSLGLQLITRQVTWEALAAELWRYVLFSEFVFDLHDQPLPAALGNVPKAPPEAKHLVEDVCRALRSDLRTQPVYVERAQQVEKELGLATHCAHLANLGPRDTFPFEERAQLRQALELLEKGDVAACQEVIGGRDRSVWRGHGESRAQWDLLQACLAVVVEADRIEQLLQSAPRTLESFVATYADRLYILDREQRQCEQTIASYLSPPSDELEAEMDRAKQLARKAYRQAAEQVQEVLLRLVEGEGWPPAGMRSSADLFDLVVAPILAERKRRVAYFHIDAFRFELGATLVEQLADEKQATITAYAAQLPTVTDVGMASLLPSAGEQLYLRNQASSLLVTLGERVLTDVEARMAVLARRFGQRFAQRRLDALLHETEPIPADVDLLVIRDSALDEHMEADPLTAFDLIPQTIRRIRMALRKLSTQGFAHAVIATDHGFVLNMQPSPGDVCPKPPGEWLNLHDRCLLGTGAADSTSAVWSAPHVGVRGDFRHLACPRGLIAYRAGTRYLHGGLSLPECIVPVITVQLAPAQQNAQTPVVTLSYRRDEKRITVRNPVVTVSVAATLFDTGPVQIRLEAVDRHGSTVGEAKVGGIVSPATGCITLDPGDTVQVPIRMQDEFEGPFRLRAFDPDTLVELAALELETDYVG